MKRHIFRYSIERSDNSTLVGLRTREAPSAIEALQALVLLLPADTIKMQITYLGNESV